MYVIVLYFSGGYVALMGSAALNKDVSSEYMIFIDCNDGTDVGKSNLTIQVRRNITEEGEHERKYLNLFLPPIRGPKHSVVDR